MGLGLSQRNLCYTDFIDRLINIRLTLPNVISSFPQVDLAFSCLPVPPLPPLSFSPCSFNLSLAANGQTFYRVSRWPQAAKPHTETEPFFTFEQFDKSSKSLSILLTPKKHDLIAKIW